MADDIIGSLGIQIEADASDLPGQYDAAVAASQEAAGRIGQAFESLIGIGAALEITEGIKAFAEAALEAYGDIEKTSISIEHMTGSIAQTTDILEQVRAIGLSSPFSFPELQDTTQKMIAMGVPVEKIGQSLQGITDAAAATGKSLLVAGGAFDRITETGSAAARQLAQLGVTTERLGDVMGVTKDQVLAAFKALPDQAARIDVLNQAMERFAGSAEAQAAGIQGAWQILENRFELVMQGIGAALEPAIKAMIGLATTAADVAQNLVDDFNTLSDPVKEFVGILGIAVAAIAPLAAGVGVLGLGLLGIESTIGSVTTLMGALGVIATETAASETTATIATTALAAAQRDLAAAEAEAAEAPMLGPLTQLGTKLEEAGVASRAGAEGISLFETGTAEASTAVEGFTLGLGGSAAIMVGPVAAGLLAMKIGYDDLKASYKAMADEMTTNSIQHLLATGTTVSDLEKMGFTIDQIRSTIGTFGIEASSVFGSLQQSTDPPIKALMGLGATVDEIKDKLKGMQVEGVPVFQILANSPDFATFRKNLELLGGNIDDVVRKLGEISTISPGVVAGFQSMSQGINVHVTSTKALDAATDALIKKQQGLDDALTLAQGVLANVIAREKDHKASAEDVAAAIANVDKAQKAANDGSKDYQDTLGGLTEAYTKQQGTINTLTTTITQLLSIQDRSAAQEAVLDTALAKRWDLIQKNITALKDQMGAENDAVTAAAKLTTSANDLLVKEQAVGIALANAKSILDQLTSSSDTSAEHQRAVIDAMNQYATAAKNAGVATNGFVTMMVNGALVSVNIDKAIQDLKTHTADFGVTVANVPKEGDSFIGFVKQSADGTVNFNAQLLDISKTLTDNVTLLTTRAIPAYQSFADIHKQLGTAADGAQSALQRMNNETQTSLNNADSALNANSGLANSIQHVGDATQSALDVENAWDNNSGPTVDHNSALANSFNSVADAAAKAGAAMTNAGVAVGKTNGSLSQFVSDTQVGLNGTNGSLSQFASDATSSMGAAGDSFKATTSEVDGLNFAASALADTMSGLAALSGTGMNFATGQGVDQAWAVAHAMGLPGYQNVTMTTPLTGDLKGSTDWLPAAYKGVTDLGTAANTLATTSAASTTSVNSLSSTIRDLSISTGAATDNVADANANAEASSNELGKAFAVTTQTFTTATTAVDFAGMSSTQLGLAIDQLNHELQSAGVVVDGAGLSAVDYATKLQSTVDGMNASAAAVQQMSQASQSAAVGIATAAAVVEAAGAMVSGVTNTGPSQQMQDALTNMTSLATPGTTDLGSKIPNILATFNGQVITGSPGMSLSSALATQDLGIGSGSSSTGPMPLYTGAPQPTGQPITVNMNYPVFSSQGQSQQTMKDIVSQIRTVTGIKQ